MWKKIFKFCLKKKKKQLNCRFILTKGVLMGKKKKKSNERNLNLNKVTNMTNNQFIQGTNNKQRLTESQNKTRPARVTENGRHSRRLANWAKRNPPT